MNNDAGNDHEWFGLGIADTRFIKVCKSHGRPPLLVQPLFRARSIIIRSGCKTPNPSLQGALRIKPRKAPKLER